MWSRYAGAGLIVQALMLVGCDVPARNATAEQTAAPVARAPAPVAGPERLILAFGDSLYAGYGLKPGESLPDMLQADLRAEGVNARVVNAGVSGDTTAGGRRRLAFSLDNLERMPDLVILGLGGNDVLRQLDPAETRANLTAMLDELKRRGVPVVLTGMRAPPNLGPDCTARFDAIYPELAQTYGAGLYPFLLDGVIGQRATMLPDGVHPNAAGVERIAERLTPVVAERLARESK